MQINLPPSVEEVFFTQAPTGSVKEVSAPERFATGYEPGEQLVFRMGGRMVAVARLRRWQDVTAGEKRPVWWPDSFKDLRGEI